MIYLASNTISYIIFSFLLQSPDTERAGGGRDGEGERCGVGEGCLSKKEAE